MVDPLFWLGLSILLVAVSLTAVLVAALPAIRELGRAARSAEKLFDTLSRELPPTLESIRSTGAEITNLTDDMTEGVQGASRVVHQVDESIDTVKHQAQQVQIVTRSALAGFRAAWGVLSGTRRPSTDRRLPEERLSQQRLSASPDQGQLPASQTIEANYDEYANAYTDDYASEYGDEYGDEHGDEYDDEHTNAYADDEPMREAAEDRTSAELQTVKPHHFAHHSGNDRFHPVTDDAIDPVDGDETDESAQGDRVSRDTSRLGK